MPARLANRSEVQTLRGDSALPRRAGVGDHSRSVLASLICVGLVLVPASPVPAQTGRPVQDGHALDANPRVGSGGYNTVYPSYTELNAANRYITGNVTGLGYFHGLSPVADPSLFRAGLGSAGLTFFNRQSVSTGAVLSGQSASGLPYYGRAETIVGTAGILAGRNVAGSSTPLSNYAPPGANGFVAPFGSDWTTVREADLRQLGQGLSVRPMSPGGAVAGESFDARAVLLSASARYAQAARSALFGVQPDEMRPLALTAPAAPEPQERDATERGGRPTSKEPANDLFSRLALADQSAVSSGEDALAAHAQRRLQSLAEKSQNRAIGELLARARVRVSAEARTTPQQRAQTGAQLETSARLSKVVLDMPLRSFASGEPNTLTLLMSAGETAMRARRYYDAAKLFSDAAAVDASSPLPILARGHALAAAGDYASASKVIQRGVQLFPRVAMWQLDLNALLGGAEACRLRCADLSRLLAAHENVDLRFLLGYLQYFSGSAAEGIENLIQAGRAAVPTSVVARFPLLLLGEDGGTGR